MLQIWSDIRQKALRCIDEVYPETDNLNAAFFPVDEFLLEAGCWIARAVPLGMLGAGRVLPTAGLDAKKDGSGTIPLPSDFIRLIVFRMKGWQRPVTQPLQVTDVRYVQQFNRTLRGGEAHPVVAISDGGSRLEYFSSSAGERAQIAEARYFALATTEDAYPKRLKDVTAWKVAELVLASMNDVAAMQQCAARVNEHLQIL